MAAITRSELMSSPVSSATFRRSRRTARRVQVRVISSISLEMKMMDMCCSRASWITIFWISVLVPMSMPRVGSSRISRSGCVTSQRAMMAFCWLPPERLRISCSGEETLICSSLMYSSAICSCSFRGMWFHMPFLA